MLRPYRFRTVRKLVERQGTPPRPRQRGHLPLEHRTAHSGHAQLERAADAVITENRWVRQFGHSHATTAHVTAA